MILYRLHYVIHVSISHGAQEIFTIKMTSKPLTENSLEKVTCNQQLERSERMEERMKQEKRGISTGQLSSDCSSDTWYVTTLIVGLP